MKPFDIQEHARQNWRGALTISGTMHWEEREKLFAVQVEDSLARIMVQVVIGCQDQQTLVLYRDDRTELVIEQRPVRPLRRSTDLLDKAVTVGKEK